MRDGEERLESDQIEKGEGSEKGARVPKFKGKPQTRLDLGWFQPSRFAGFSWHCIDE